MEDLRGYSRFFFERYRELYGSDFQSFLEVMDREPRESIRANSLVTKPGTLAQDLRKKGFVIDEKKEAPFLISRGGPFPLASTSEFLQGKFYIQGLAEMAVVPQMDCRAGEANWDMCAAPGGKTTQMAEHMENSGAILATDVSQEKLRALKNNLARLGVTNTIVIREDARRLEAPLKFNKILLDVPCTGSGIIRKDPSRKSSRSIKDVTFMSAIQKGLLQRSVKMLEDSGTLVYSTCSLEPEENEILIDWAISSLPLELSAPKKSFLKISPGFTDPFGKELDGSISKCGRIHPHLNDSNGMFFAILKKT